MLSASVPPLVNAISPGCAPISRAACTRAFSTVRRASCPNAWMLDGFPGPPLRRAAISSITSGSGAVVALLSR